MGLTAGSCYKRISELEERALKFAQTDKQYILYDSIHKNSRQCKLPGRPEAGQWPPGMQVGREEAHLVRGRKGKSEKDV